MLCWTSQREQPTAVVTSTVRGVAALALRDAAAGIVGIGSAGEPTALQQNDWR